MTPIPLRLVADPYPPYQYLSNGRVIGIDHDFIAAVFRVVSHRTTARLLDWSLCLQAMRDGSADAVFQITPTPERQEWLLFSRSFRTARTLLYKLTSSDIGDLSFTGGVLAMEHRLGVLRGFSYGSVIDGAPSKLEARTDAELLAALRRHDIDLAAIDEGVAQYLLGSDPDVSPVGEFCLTRTLHLACRRNSPEIVVAFDAGLDAFAYTA